MIGNVVAAILDQYNPIPLNVEYLVIAGGGGGGGSRGSGAGAGGYRTGTLSALSKSTNYTCTVGAGGTGGTGGTKNETPGNNSIFSTIGFASAIPMILAKYAAKQRCR